MITGIANLRDKWSMPGLLVIFVVLGACLSVLQARGESFPRSSSFRLSFAEYLRRQANETDQDHPPIFLENALTVRAIWAHGGTSADTIVRNAIQGGFDTVFYWIGGGVAQYNSTLLPTASQITPENDPLERLVKLAHAHGLKVEAWWGVGRAARDSEFRDRYPGWSISDLVDIPDDFHWLNFSLPEVRRFVGDVVVEIATKYQVDGVHLDYIRYVSPPPYNEVDCRLFFNPDDVPMTVRDAYERLKAVRPVAQLTAAVMASQASSANHMQNWADWLAGDYIDYVVPMAYTDPDENTNIVRFVREWRALPRPERIVPGQKVEYTTDSGEKSAKSRDEFLYQLALFREGGFPGFSVFNESTITVSILDALRLLRY